MKNLKFLALAATLTLAPFSNALVFQISVTNRSLQPLSPVFFASSDNTFDAFVLGRSASGGIKNIAELGDATQMLNLAANSGGVMDFGVMGSTPILAGETRIANIEADASHPYFTFASMLGKTNDGFIGESSSSMGLKLFDGANANNFSVEINGSRAWDAGTEQNTQNAADLIFLNGTGNPMESGTIGVHESIAVGVGDSWALMPDWDQTTPLATLTVTVVPEPASLMVFGTALVAAGLKRRKR